MSESDDTQDVQDDGADSPRATPLADHVGRFNTGTWRVVAGLAVAATLVGFGMQLANNGSSNTATESTDTQPGTTEDIAPPTTRSDEPPGSSNAEETTTTTTPTATTAVTVAAPFVAADEVLTLAAGAEEPTMAVTLEVGAVVQADLVEGSTAQPPSVSNLYVQVWGPGRQECQWAVAQRNEAGIVGMDDDPERNFLFVVETVRDDEIDVRVYDIRGRLDLDEEPDDAGCRGLGVLGLDTPIPDWLIDGTEQSLTQLATASGGARFDEVIEAASAACSTYGERDHGSTIQIAGFDHEVVWAPAHAERRERDENERGGYPAAVTGDGPFLIIGTEGGDDLISHTASDVICGNGGDDVLTGKEGDDLIIGGAGSDRLRATSGLNILVGDDDDTELTGGTETDWCSDVTNTFGSCEEENRF